MEEQYPQVELQVDVENDEIEAAIFAVLSPLELELTVQRSLQEAGILQPVGLELVITDDETIRELNKQYRQIDKATNVLSFPFLNTPLVHAPAEDLWSSNEEAGVEDVAKLPEFITPSELATNLGDVVISWPTVIRQAAEGGHSAAYELLYLLSHGVLHLIGYDDATEAGYAAMIRIQQSVLQTLQRKA